MATKGSIRLTIKPGLDSMDYAFKTMRNNPEVQLRSQQLFYEFMKPYVPYDTGHLSEYVSITKTGVRFLSPYSHYQYTGEVYGPNFLVKDKKTGAYSWKSPKGTGSKIPMGKNLTYSNPLASDHWDEAMMRDRRDELCKALGSMISRYLNSLRGKKK